METMQENIVERKAILLTIKTEIIQRLNIQREADQIDDDTALFGNGLRLDSVDATEILVLLDKVFNIQVSEGDDPAYMRTINNLASFIIQKKRAAERP
ncbi:acyl carrier protein [Mixta theicola]|uniref:Acyl carrier protein n=1 Tax=Mixta theicola TaxID=1458355 RepID=A0A2K1QEI0_9GAMM|nr:phosphopantetheine-binding protein [Mixta theicola]PNS13435.1 acyl carrier protein [Mixta theicola]GLR09750.1 acyl carrier protein [Mixta theicola]